MLLCCINMLLSLRYCSICRVPGFSPQRRQAKRTRTNEIDRCDWTLGMHVPAHAELELLSDIQLGRTFVYLFVLFEQTPTLPSRTHCLGRLEMSEIEISCTLLQQGLQKNPEISQNQGNRIHNSTYRRKESQREEDCNLYHNHDGDDLAPATLCLQTGRKHTKSQEGPKGFSVIHLSP